MYRSLNYWHIFVCLKLIILLLMYHWIKYKLAMILKGHPKVKKIPFLSNSVKLNLEISIHYQIYQPGQYIHKPFF